MNYILHVNKNPTKADVEKISKEYVYGNTILHTVFSKSFIKKYEALCISTLERLLLYKDVEDRIIEMAHTWDNYSLSIVYLKYIYYFNVKGFIKNNFIIFFSQLLTQNIHPNYEKRHTIKDTKQLFKEFWYDETIHNTSNFLDILSNIQQTVEDIRDIVRKDIEAGDQIKQLITVS